MQTISPLTRRQTECTILRTIPTSTIRSAYQREFRYDPIEEFKHVEELHLLRCPDTDLRFFSPLDCAGREGLYRRLETFEWNYKETKWEHDLALRFVSPMNRVLDVGCGRAAFLARAKASCQAQVTGLEFNASAAAFGRDRGVEVLTETIQDHAAARPANYDLVASFQVLEHVTDPASFIEACIAALKPGGTLLLGVPNEDSFLGLLEDNWLNMPPHHMSLWTKRCLEGLPSLFPIKHLDTHLEPLQERGWFKSVFERRHLKGRLRRFAYYRLGLDQVFKGYIDDAWASIPGHTIMARFVRKA